MKTIEVGNSGKKRTPDDTDAAGGCHYSINDEGVRGVEENDETGGDPRYTALR